MNNPDITAILPFCLPWKQKWIPPWLICSLACSASVCIAPFITLNDMASAFPPSSILRQVSGLGAVKVLAFYDVQPDSPLVKAGIPTLLPLVLDTNIDDKDLQVTEYVRVGRV